MLDPMFGQSKQEVLTIAAYGAHPDDVELSCAGTLLAMKALGHRIGIVDLTKGELGTRGTPAIRHTEAKAAELVIGLDFRELIGLPDGSIVDEPDQRLQVIKSIRSLRPHILLANAMEDRHPDHGGAAFLVEHAAFLAGLRNIETVDDQNMPQEPWRPRLVLHYIQDRQLKPDIVVDITPYWETKLKAIMCYKSQFSTGTEKDSDGPQTYISSPTFMETIKARGRSAGSLIGVEFGEGFTCRKTLGVASLAHLI